MKECKPFSVRPFSTETSISLPNPIHFSICESLVIHQVNVPLLSCALYGYVFLVRMRLPKIRTITRPNDHDMPPRRTKAAPHYTIYSRHPFLWPQKPGIPIAKPDISLVTSYHLRSVGIRMSLRKNKNVVLQNGGEQCECTTVDGNTTWFVLKHNFATGF